MQEFVVSFRFRITLAFFFAVLLERAIRFNFSIKPFALVIFSALVVSVGSLAVGSAVMFRLPLRVRKASSVLPVC